MIEGIPSPSDQHGKMRKQVYEILRENEKEGS